MIAFWILISLIIYVYIGTAIAENAMLKRQMIDPTQLGKTAMLWPIFLIKGGWD